MTGTANVKKDTTKSHADSKTHKSSILKATPVPPENQEIRKLIIKLDKAIHLQECVDYLTGHI